MKHHILLPTDFSENAWSAMRYALKLYANKPCKFYLLHAWSFINTGSRTYITSSYVDTVKEEAYQKLVELKNKAESESTNKNHEFDVILSTESIFDSIETAVKTHNINMLIMGTKGASGAKEFLFGSNTVSILNKMRLCPVLVVPNALEFTKPKQIGFPSDFKRPFGKELLHLEQVSELYNSQIKIVHINETDNLSDEQNNNLELLLKHLDDHSNSLHWMPDYGTKEQAINDFIEEFDIKLLAMINYKHGFMENLIKEPVVKKIGYHTMIPFLVIPSID